MFGDDPDPTVTTNRVGYGTTFGRAGGDRGRTREVSWFDKREPKTRLVSERSTKARGLMSSEKREKRAVRLIREKVNRETEEAATTSGCKF